MAQDYSLFHILTTIQSLCGRADIADPARHGLMQMIVHPDYIIDETARRVYADLLSYLCELRAAGKTGFASG